MRRQFVFVHEAYGAACSQCVSWCDEFATRLDTCLVTDGSLVSVESQLRRLNELSTECGAKGAERVETVRDAAVVVLSSTSVDGCSTVNDAVLELTAYWESLVDKLSSACDRMEALLGSCNAFDTRLSALLRQLSDAEEECERLSMLQSTMAEKMSCVAYSQVCLSTHLTVSLSDSVLRRLLLLQYGKDFLPLFCSCRNFVCTILLTLVTDAPGCVGLNCFYFRSY